MRETYWSLIFCYSRIISVTCSPLSRRERPRLPSSPTFQTEPRSRYCQNRQTYIIVTWNQSSRDFNTGCDGSEGEDNDSPEDEDKDDGLDARAEDEANEGTCSGF